MPISPEQTDELKAIVASVYYLETEAKKSGLDELSLIFKKTIADIENWACTNVFDKNTYIENLVDCELYSILSLLDKFSKCSKFNLKATLQAIEYFDDIRRKSN